MADYLEHPERYPKNYLEEAEYIKTQITKRLADYPNLVEVILLDVSAKHIQVSGRHKCSKDYLYRSVFMEYDFSNADEVIEEFVSTWIKGDVPEQIRDFTNFIYQGRKYGWD